MDAEPDGDKWLTVRTVGVNQVKVKPFVSKLPSICESNFCFIQDILCSFRISGDAVVLKCRWRNQTPLDRTWFLSVKTNWHRDLAALIRWLWQGNCWVQADGPEVEQSKPNANKAYCVDLCCVSQFLQLFCASHGAQEAVDFLSEPCRKKPKT